MSISIGMLALVALTAGQDDQVRVLQEMVQELRQEVSELKNKKSDTWINEHRADEIRDLVHDVLADSDARVNLVGDGLTSGYANGAFIASPDGNWKLKINGQLQVRWIYNDAEGLASQHGFEQRRTKLTFSGHAVDPSWTFKVSPNPQLFNSEPYISCSMLSD